MSTVVKARIVALLLASACDKGPSVKSNDGAQVYQSICATCHGPEGVPSSTMAARLSVRDLTSAEFRARATPALVEQQVRNGSQNKLMPAMAGALTDEQIKAVSTYVASPAFPTQ